MKFLSALKARGGALMLSENTIKVPFQAGFVTNGIRLLFFALALAARPCAAEETPQDRQPPGEIVLDTHVYTHGALTVHRLTLGKLAANCYLVADAQKNAVVIDPGAAPEAILRYLAGQRLRVLAYVLTHSHLDHISALDELVAAAPAEVAMHPAENDWAFCDKNAWLPWYPRTREVAIKRPLRHRQTFTDGGLRYTVIHTPGHSPGSVCLWFPSEGLVFTGDTLFAGTVGRTDLHRSSSTSLIRSLGVFLMMPPETAIYAGHGEPTTVEAELETNPFMQDVPNPTKEKAANKASPEQPARTE
jgi:glyoxylase-like metal-dependent hydrolase (beta-lactamase superfamily II)